MLTNGESSKESSSEANNINNEHIATEADPSDKPSNTCEKSANEIGEKSANETNEKSANEIIENSATDMNIDTTGNRVIVDDGDILDDGEDDILDDDAEVDFHTTLVNVWADISKELEVGFIVFSSEATL